jgi:hypothetical protein
VSWTSATDLKAQVRRLWERGELLRSVVDDCVDTAVAAAPVGREPAKAGTRSGCAFPLRLVMKGPTSAELAEHFQAVREWIAELASVAYIRIEWREFNHRVLGVQRVPQTIRLDELDSALAMIGRRGDAARFAELLVLVRSRQPALLLWFRQRPLQALELADECERLLAVVDWIARHPRPGIYLRQVDIAGVHSKFIESRRGVLTEWLDLVLPPDAVAAERNGGGQFAARFGFREKPARIRFRLLDARLPMLPGPVFPDIAVDSDSFAALAVPIRRVFITENETNFLAFPPVADAIVVFGAGYGWDALSKAAWLSRCSIHYWGDIDTHGFAILDQLRGRFDHVESLLMDRATLMAHEALWGDEHDPVCRDLPRLNEAEQALFDELRDNRLRGNVRLEQEHIGFQWVEAAIAAFAGG